MLTGTPEGVGQAMDPPRFLEAGDVVRLEVEGLGAIEHTIAVAVSGANVNGGIEDADSGRLRATSVISTPYTVVEVTLDAAAART